MNIDSLNCIYTTKVDSLIKLNEQTQIGQNYFSDILSHQWVLLSIQTAIFIGIILIIIALVGFVSWKFYFNKIQNRLTEIEKKQNEVEKSKEKLHNLENRVALTYMNTMRSLYEQPKDLRWKIIWHIRYCECFFESSDFVGLQIHLKNLEKEMIEIKMDDLLFKALKKFENISGVKNILRKIIQDPRSGSIPVNVLAELETV